MPELREPLVREGDLSAYDAVYALVSQPVPSDPTMNALSNFLALSNAAIPIFMTLIVLALVIFVFRWIVSKPGTVSHRVALDGVARAAIGIFLVVNIWVLIRLVDLAVSFSDAAAYGIVFLALLLFGFWSAYNIGANILALSAAGTD
ncbi:hypothetical protein COU20_00455 [Candidatus Kaiserbacteria bacterium CG10_big_fil_rev_8_21_14_0_10_59_10]|uniref:Uncharacterized protein n=1 Tax=Candidatus Kaiserbacteria bacterium CG10_big_fil_rev_8_21_14_0_10_59_10 TaxID=1974612 RepID=A0A2H0UAI0_9BACT|nr:MAG: hypothetical protein COU20_00455 [Candidatus Kaiserbacteria bacterium CG10_big_fil_rev_8_21_14_0_10_59_10]